MKEATQPTRRSQEIVMNDLRKAVLQIKKDTSTPKPVVYQVNKILNEHKLAVSVTGALIKLDMLTVRGEGRSREFQWKYGAQPIDFEQVYRVYCELQTAMKNATPSRQKAIQKAHPVQHVTKVVQSSQMPKNIPKTDGHKKVVEVEKGTIFRFKQLEFLGHMMRKMPTKVIIDGKFVVDKVKVISFTIDGNRLTMGFYEFGDAHTLGPDYQTMIGSLAMENVVLEFLESDKPELRINTMSVNDPYQIKV